MLPVRNEVSARSVGEMMLDVVLLETQLRRIDVAFACDERREVVQVAPRRARPEQIPQLARVAEGVADLLSAIRGRIGETSVR